VTIFLHRADRPSGPASSGSGIYPGRHDLSSLRLLGSVGSRINPKAWLWYHSVIGGSRCPIVDTWWQTETGAIMISPLPGVTTTKPGSATRPLPGISAKLVTEDGEPMETGTGVMVIDQPWPVDAAHALSGRRSLRGDVLLPVRAEHLPGRDAARRDDDGYFWIIGSDRRRHQCVRTPAVNRRGRVRDRRARGRCRGRRRGPERRGPRGRRSLRSSPFRAPGRARDEAADAIRNQVAEKIGKFARPNRIIWADDLPRPGPGRSAAASAGHIAEGRELGDVTTLRDPM